MNYRTTTQLWDIGWYEAVPGWGLGLVLAIGWYEAVPGWGLGLVLADGWYEAVPGWGLGLVLAYDQIPDTLLTTDWTTSWCQKCADALTFPVMYDTCVQDIWLFRETHRFCF